MAASTDLYITLNESRFFTAVIEFSTHPSCPSRKPVRVAGGWVRDKLLKIDVDDLDIAVEDCMGTSYASAFVNWLVGVKQIHSTIPSVIKSNPEKSKHLETSMISIPSWNLKVDVCNLRTEIYTSEHRFPSIDYGTPGEDAHRRDLTINSLFYNIMENCIEDYTTLGLADLAAKVLRTPLPPMVTFADDPLRILRVVRFASRFPSFSVDDSIDESVQSEAIRNAFIVKISPSRVMQEFQKLVQYESIEPSITLLTKWNFWGLIFNVPNYIKSGSDMILASNDNCDSCILTGNVIQSDISKSVKYALTGDELLIMLRDNDYANLKAYCPIVIHEYESLNARGLFVFSMLLYNLYDYKISVGRDMHTALEISLQAIECHKLSRQANAVVEIMRSFTKVIQGDHSRQALIAPLSHKSSADFWFLSLVGAIVRQHSHLSRYELSAKLDCIIDLVYNRYKLNGVWKLTPLLNGHEIVHKLKITGSKIGIAQKHVREYQLLHYSSDSVLSQDDAISYVLHRMSVS